VIDGKLDDPAWQSVPWTDPFVDIEGDRKPKPRFETRVKMTWDDQCLYVGARLEEPHVCATLTHHDAVIFHDDDFELFVDPDGDSHLYGELEVNALATTWDLLLPTPYKDGGLPIDGWEIAGLRCAVHVDGTLNDSRDVDRGWSVEMALPWSSLTQLTSRHEPPRDGDQWRIDFSRVEWRHTIGSDGSYAKVPDQREDNWVWSPQWVVDMHRPETWGYVQFSTEPAGVASFRPDPDWAAKQQLHRVYYTQKSFRESHGRWARTLAELTSSDPTLDDDVGALTMQTTDDWFEVTVETRSSHRRWHIRADAKIWSDA
jgi:hypothetical protein